MAYVNATHILMRVLYFTIIISCGVMCIVEEPGYNPTWLSFVIGCRIDMAYDS